MAEPNEWPWSAKIGSILAIVVVVGGGIWQVAANTTAIATLNPEAIKDVRDAARAELEASASDALTSMADQVNSALESIAVAREGDALGQPSEVAQLNESLRRQSVLVEEYKDRMEMYFQRRWCSYRDAYRQAEKEYNNAELVPIEVSVSATTVGEGPSRCDFEIIVNGARVVAEINLRGGRVCGTFLTIPPGASYEVRPAVDEPLEEYELDIRGWHELRPSC